LPLALLPAAWLGQLLRVSLPVELQRLHQRGRP